jgi:hypothetical protein
VAKDFRLLAEAYSRIYEAGEEVTGSIAGKNSSYGNPNIGIPKDISPMPIDQNAQNMSDIKFNTPDSTKILRNISEVYRKTKEVAEVLKKYNVPGAMENLKAETYRLAVLASQIVAKTPEAVTNVGVKSKLYANLDKEVAVMVPAEQPAQTAAASQTAIQQSTPSIVSK